MSNIHYIWKTPDVVHSFKTAISLHGHTQFSKESLHFIRNRAEKIALLRAILRNQEKYCIKPKADFSRAFWTAPMTPRGAYELERAQIESKLNLASIVSITDHDNIEAPLQLRLLPKTRHIPISLEWTVPYEGMKVHLGIYNLPSSSARQWLAEMHAYTRNSAKGDLRCLLAGLCEIKDLLVVLNHPMWDLCAVGRKAHLTALEQFLHKHNQFLHAFEMGGLRSWEENQRVVDLSHAWNQTIISGGDRHGREPNAVLNLTRATTFAEFVEEIRLHRKSHLVFMPQYQHSLTLRVLHSLNDVTDYIAEHPLGPNWDDRTYHPDAFGEIRPLSQIWDRVPGIIRFSLAAIRTIEEEPVKALAQYIWRSSKNAFRLRPLSENGEPA